MYFIDGQGVNTCNDTEICISLYDCPSLGERVLESVNQSFIEINYLRSKQCGYENKQVFVCCILSTSERASIGHLGGTYGPGDTVIGNSVKSSVSGRGTILPSPPECGPVLANRVWGGTATHVFEFPWMAMLEYEKTNGLKVFLCGGSLINHRYVITAAHCVVATDLILIGVRLGEWDRRTNPDCQTDPNGRKICTNLSHVNLGIDETIVHNNYESNSNSPHNDIALIRLSHEVEYNSIIRPICLPKRILFNEFFIGSKMDVSGWGFTEANKPADVKIKAELGIWNLSDCRKIYPNISLSDSQMCAGGEENIDACKGDSGGPLMTIYESAYTLAGIVSFGPVACGTKNQPGIYTRVAAFKDWIQMKLKP